MIYGSVCSGIEAATAAWHPLGWKPSFFSEIEPFPCAVLDHHYPTIPNLGDMLQFERWNDAALDILVGGTPCQSFSVAGLRAGLADPRGNLMLTFGALVGRYRPRWCLWENVPGVLSSNGGRDFGSFLGMLGLLGYGFAYRVLDAQFFGVPQRRRRVFVVGYLGDWRSAAAVLFERESLRGYPAPRREERQNVAPTIAARTKGGGGLGTDFDCDGGLIAAFGGNNTEGAINVATACNAHGGRQDFESETFLVDSAPPIAFSCKDNGRDASANLAPTLRAMPHDGSHANGGGQLAVAFNARQDPIPGPIPGPIDTDASTQCVQRGMAVRRLTPRECERLQGFPDGYTDIRPRGKLTADGPRYKALGNSMAVPVMRWIGDRIAMVEARA